MDVVLFEQEKGTFLFIDDEDMVIELDNGTRTYLPSHLMRENLASNDPVVYIKSLLKDSDRYKYTKDFIDDLAKRNLIETEEALLGRKSYTLVLDKNSYIERCPEIDIIDVEIFKLLKERNKIIKSIPGLEVEIEKEKKELKK